MFIPGMPCAQAGADADSNAQSRNGIFAIADTLAAARAKVEQEIRSRRKSRRVACTEKEKGRVQNTRPFLRS
jgi:hypothetical protein